MVGAETAHKYQTLLYLAGSASAEFFADIGLCPWEAVKVHCLPALCLLLCPCSCGSCREFAGPCGGGE